MEASYCLCGQPYDPNIFMIQCDACKDWFHSSCCNFQEHLAIEIDKYHCPKCAPIFGPSIYKPYRNWHRHDYWDEDATTKPVQTGTGVFIRELLARHFASEGEVVVHMRGQQITETLLQQQGFNNPIVVDGKDGLDMTLPPDNFSLYDVESYVGGDMEIDVIDVTRQCNIKMKLRDYVEYYNSLNRTRVFNVVSLEFSKTALAPLVEAPSIARKLDWANIVWPRDFPLERPQVQKYCLMSVKDSYTDFHIDFGGTSVWYHVLRGEKIFYLIRPTPANLTLYQQWMTSSNQSETFFGDQVDRCYKCILRQGQTMMIPTGWIHAVLTPIDSLVFGGNFLQSLNIPMQLAVYDIEKKVKTDAKYRYPNFELINWFAASHLLKKISELNSEDRKCPNHLLVGLKTLLITLKQWNSEKDYNTSVRDQIPYTINPVQLLKDMSREIRHAERIINQLNPPKPERESKRKRRRPINRDFVDYSLSPKSSAQDFISETKDYARQPPLKLSLPKPVTYPYDRPNFMEQRINVEEQSWLSPQFSRPEQTTAIHRGGAVLKFKLGSKDILPHSHADDIPEEQFDFKSVYDFHDESDRDEDCFNFTIDENPPPKKSKKQSSAKFKFPANFDEKAKKGKDPVIDIDGDLPKNGIESLLKASALTTTDNNGRTSPSTQEAIAGMLSISQTYLQSGKANARSVRKYSTSPPLEDGNLNNVHQDEDYIYPSLDNSDDEDIHIFKPRGRSKIDEAWNPKARVGPLLPKMNRPAREGTKKQSVEKVLEAAAARRANETPEKAPKRQYRRKKIKQKLEIKSPASNTVAVGSSSSASTPKPRKGMKTVKQRLGKILKIHKMMH
ncbi:lysine-specific demethylase 7B [Tribolium castaneum]|uniref:Histone lysine demethylase PHF8-like Protein n=1 Tax=Tribolium castaneum TaxID=7070 RepID=D6W7H8_TRICA|nr:PREDICTED: lysine-specific demethylase 7B [Tribolium castaneum]EFA11284.1 Histone lysine demethylase PHF8-like Protein [Tribolium castaneum]|eukprot:XP_969145.1 PREDICTED: lysine-specific demethylase 7B [Tribolium castaneum]